MLISEDKHYEEPKELSKKYSVQGEVQLHLGHGGQELEPFSHGNKAQLTGLSQFNQRSHTAKPQGLKSSSSPVPVHGGAPTHPLFQESLGGR